MVDPPGDPRRDPIAAAANTGLAIGVLLVVSAGVAILMSCAGLAVSDRAQSSDIALVLMLDAACLLPGVAFLVSASHLVRRRRWAATSLVLLGLPTGLGGLFLVVASLHTDAIWVSLFGAVGGVTLLTLAIVLECQLARALPVLAPEPCGFEPIMPEAPRPAASPVQKAIVEESPPAAHDPTKQ